MTATPQNHQDRTGRDDRGVGPGFEPRDVPAGGVVRAVIGLFAGIALSAALVAGLVLLLTPRLGPEQTQAIGDARPGPAGPRLQVDPRRERAAVEAAAAAKLQGYRWIDGPGRRVHIPIDRAMQILAARGWPAHPAHPAPDRGQGEGTTP
jgi:hypothetical protein